MVFFDPMASYKVYMDLFHGLHWAASPGGIFEGFERVGRPEVLHRRATDPRP